MASLSRCVALALFFLFAARAEALTREPHAQAQHSLQAAEDVAALAAAQAYAANSHNETNGRTIVVQHIRGFIVVSFINPCRLQHSCYGGRLHIVYDPARKKVVSALGED